MEVTDLNKDGQTFLCQIAVYKSRTIQVKEFVVGGWRVVGWMVEVFGCV